MARQRKNNCLENLRKEKLKNEMELLTDNISQDLPETDEERNKGKRWRNWKRICGTDGEEEKNCLTREENN